MSTKWEKITVRYKERMVQLEREYNRLREKRKKAEIDGRMEKKLEECRRFRMYSEVFYKRCLDVISALSGQTLNYNYSSAESLFNKEIPLSVFERLEIELFGKQFMTGNMKTDFFNDILISNKPFVTAGPDLSTMASIRFGELGEIIFLLEQDVTSLKMEFNLIATRYGFHHEPGDQTRSSRIEKEYIPLTVQDITQWENWHRIFNDIEIENCIAASIKRLIESLPYYRPQDLKL